MLLRLTIILIICIIVGPGAAQAQTSCTFEEWRSVPQILPSPTYESQNDQDLIYREVVIRRGLPIRAWGLELSKAAKTFFSIQSTLGIWDSHLHAAEKQFWTDLSQKSQVNSQLKNEYAYWLHKRELWLSALSVQITGAKLSGVQGFDKVLNFTLGGATSAFRRPSEFADVNTPTIVDAPRKETFNAEYRAHFRNLSYYGFLTQSPCSPRRSLTVGNKLIYEMLFPFGAVDMKLVNRVKKWSSRNPQIAAELLSKLQSSSNTFQKTSVSASQIIQRFMDGETDVIDKLVAEELDIYLQVEGVGGGALKYILDNTEYLQMVDAKGYPLAKIYYSPLSPIEVRGCLKENWVAIRSYFLTETGNSQGVLRLLSSATYEGLKLSRDFTYVGVIGCTSNQSFSDPRVAELIAPYRNR